MISYLDDRSRFITGSIKIWSPTGENAMLLLDRAVKRYGAPRQILTDQGTQFKPARGEVSLLIYTVLSWELSIFVRVFADLLRVAKLKHFIKPTSWSLISLKSTGVSYDTTTIRGLTRG
jgi:hypothetical protein